jgi:dihydroflavonol-4-reductase
MKKVVLVTGATGFIGRHTVDALLQAGFHVRALCRNTDEDLEAMGVEVVPGDVLQPSSVVAAMQGTHAVVHGAGFVSRDLKDGGHMHRLHVTGTRIVADAAVAARTKVMVHLSTSGVVAVGNDPNMVYREDDPVPFSHLQRFPYYQSKWLAERAAADATAESSTVLVTLNPSLALGPGDSRGSSTEDVRRFLKREIPVVPSGGVSFVDARDVATMVPAAISQGQPGHRYLLGAVNNTFAQFFDKLTQVSGVRGPLVPFALPGKVTTWGISIMETIAGTMGAKLPVTSIEADMSSSFWYCDSRKAIAELGFQPRDPMATLRDTVQDIRGQLRVKTIKAVRASTST